MWAGFLQPAKLNNFEKTKKEKPGLLIFDELEELAAQAKAKGGAQNLDEADINIRLKWLGLFHRYAGRMLIEKACTRSLFLLKEWN